MPVDLIGALLGFVAVAIGTHYAARVLRLRGHGDTLDAIQRKAIMVQWWVERTKARLLRPVMFGANRTQPREPALMPDLESK